MCGIFDPCSPFIKCRKESVRSLWGDYEVSECGIGLQEVGGSYGELGRIAKLSGLNNILSYDDIYADMRKRQPEENADELKRQANRFMDEICRTIHKK